VVAAAAHFGNATLMKARGWHDDDDDDDDRRTDDERSRVEVEATATRCGAVLSDEVAPCDSGMMTPCA